MTCTCCSLKSMRLIYSVALAFLTNSIAGRTFAWTFLPAQLPLNGRPRQHYCNSLRSFRVHRFGSCCRHSSALGRNNSDQLPVLQDDKEEEMLKLANNHVVMLMSLKYVGSTTDPKQFSKAVTDLWRWKDSVLGDGNDFFIPKPRTLTVLQRYIMVQLGRLLDPQSVYIKECVILSNCARFEILLVLDLMTLLPLDEHKYRTIINGTVGSLSDLLNRQVRYLKNSRLKPLHSPFDWPGAIDQTESDGNYFVDSEVAEASRDLAKNWNVLIGVSEVAHHLCHIAAGLAPHPRHPHREILFRPFSSRDAHILLQLKRTLDISTRKDNIRSRHGNTHHNYAMIPNLLRYAIQAGKAARNPDIVPILHELRRLYGTGNSKFDGIPPPNFMVKVTSETIKKAVDPVIMDCVKSFKAMEKTNEITVFRQKAIELAANDQDILSFIKKRLHEPTMLLRNGELVDEVQFFKNLSADLDNIRQSIGQVQ